MNTSNPSKPPLLPVSLGTIPEPVSVRLDNGIPVFIIEAGTEDVLRLDFTFDAGHAKESIPLLSSTVNLMLTEGTRNYSASKLNKTLDFHGSFYNLYADKDRAGILFFVLSKHFEKILDLAGEILFCPAFPESEFKTLMKKRQRWFLVSRNKVANLAMDQFYESIFGVQHPYGRQIREDDFRNLSTGLLREFHEGFYLPENLAIIISGKIPSDAIGHLNKYFGGISAKGKNNTGAGRKIVSGETKRIHIEKEGALQTAVRIGSPAINKLHPDYLGLKVVDVILGGYFNSRLMKNIREEKGLTYGIHSVLSSFVLGGFKVISAEVSKKSTHLAIDEVYKEIQILQSVPVDKAELETVKNFMIGELIRMFDGPFALAESFRSVWDFGLDNYYYYRLAEKIKSIEPDEITGLAKTYYNIDDLYQITAG